MIWFNERNPSALILVGEDETPLTLRPTGSATHKSAQRDTPMGNLWEATYRWVTPEGYALSWITTGGRFGEYDDNVTTLRVRVENLTDKPIRLRYVTLAQSAQAFSCQGELSDWYLSSLHSTPLRGDLAQKPPIPAGQRGIWENFFEIPSVCFEEARDVRVFRDTVTLYAEGGEEGVMMGAVGIASDVSFWFGLPETYLLPDLPLGFPEMDILDEEEAEMFGDEDEQDEALRNDRIQLAVEIRAEMSDVILSPGEARDSEEVLLITAPYENAMNALLRWRNETHGNRRHRPAPFGWCSWYDRYADIDSDHIAGVIAAADALKNRLPLDFIQIDMGYETLWGDWRPHPAKFPDGLSRHVEAIRDNGARPGIWFALLGAHDSLGLQESYPDRFQQNAKRERENGGDGGHYLDPTHPDVKEYVRAILRQARADGFTYFKCDYNLIRGRMYDATKTRLQAYRDFYALIRETIGEDAYLLACSGYERGVLGFADAARTGIDSVPVWHDPNTVLCLTCVYPTILANAVTNGTFGFNDPDVTYSSPTTDKRTGGNINLKEWRVWHGIVGLLGGLTAISEPLAELTDERIRALEILRPPVAERGRCLGAAVGDWTRFGFLARRAFGDFATLLLWNPKDVIMDVPLNPHGLFAKRERFYVWSFWDGTYLGIQGEDFVAKDLPPHSGLHLRLTPLSPDNRPVLIGSDLHIGCGAAEIADFAATRRGVAITLSDGGAREGNLYLYSDAPLQLMSAECCTVTGVVEVAPSVWRVAICGRQWGVPQKIHLEATA